MLKFLIYRHKVKNRSTKHYLGKLGIVWHKIMTNVFAHLKIYILLHLGLGPEIAT